MKYLKVFNEKNSDSYYEELNIDKISAFFVGKKVSKFSEEEIFKIKKYFNFYTYVSYSLQHGCKLSISFILNSFPGTEEITIIIIKYGDEWYYISAKNIRNESSLVHNTRKFFVCDQFEGLKKWLEDSNIIMRLRALDRPKKANRK